MKEKSREMLDQVTRRFLQGVHGAVSKGMKGAVEGAKSAVEGAKSAVEGAKSAAQNVQEAVQTYQEARLKNRPPAPPPAFRVLVALGGGPHAASVLETLPGLAAPGYEVNMIRVRNPGAPGGTSFLESALGRLRGASTLARAREVVSTDVRGTLIGASREADLLVLGTSLGPRPASNSLTLEIAKRSACPVILIRSGDPSGVAWNARRALVVGERTAAGRLGLNRALRWGLAGAGSLDVILGASDDPFAKLEPEPRPLDEDPAYSSVRSLDDTMDGPRIVEELEKGKHNILVLAIDPSRLDGARRWVDSMLEKTSKPVVLALAGRKGPRTRTRLPSVQPVGV